MTAKAKSKNVNTNENSKKDSQSNLFSEQVMDKSILAHPFLKWAGGKKQITDILRGLAPSKYKRYFEPFLGGGAMFFALQPKEAFLSDINPDLINAYTVVRDNLDKLCQDLKKHKYDKEYYYSLRDADRHPSFTRWKAVSKASRLIYLNKTCYNGLYRVNSLGQFNVPFGRYKKPCWLDVQNLCACQNALQGKTLATMSFEKILSEVQKDDFIYIDPPYAPLSSTSNFTTFHTNGFGQDEQERLRNFCLELNKRGAKWILSNSSAPLIFDLYKGFKILKIEANRSINSKAGKRGSVTELLIMNY